VANISRFLHLDNSMCKLRESLDPIVKLDLNLNRLRTMGYFSLFPLVYLIKLSRSSLLGNSLSHIMYSISFFKMPNLGTESSSMTVTAASKNMFKLLGSSWISSISSACSNCVKKSVCLIEFARISSTHW